MDDFETDRLKLRKFKRKDVNDMFEFTSDKKVAEYSDFIPHTSKDETLMNIECAIHDYGTYESCWAIEEKISHKVIGYIQMFNASLKNKQCSITWALNQNYWGQGYSEEILKTMFKHLFDTDLFDIIIVKYYSNRALFNHILENVGMKRDATLRNRRINSITGEKESLIIYSIIKEEFSF